MPADTKLTADTRLIPGGKLALPVKLMRTDVASPVRLTLLTSQAPPLANWRETVMIGIAHASTTAGETAVHQSRYRA